MKLLNKYLFTGILIIAGIYTAHSQNPGCNGIRYLHPVFDSLIITSDIIYGHNTTVGGISIDLKMDVYEPYPDSVNTRPVVFLVHGGGFTSGSKSGGRYVMLGKEYARKGYVAVSIDYRLYDLKMTPDSFLLKDAVVRGMSDLNAAMRYMHDDAEGQNLFRVDTSYYFLMGVSSGAIIANTTAYLDDINEADNQMKELIALHGGLQGNSSNNLEFRPKPKAVLNSSGGLFDYTYIDDDDPELISAHCPEDPVMPFKRDWLVMGGDSVIIAYGSYFLNAMANLNGVQNELLQVPGTVHVQYFLDTAIYNNMINTAVTVYQDIICADTGSGPPTVIGEQSKLLSASVYPNPANDYLNINDITSGEIELYNTLGMLAKRMQINGKQINIGDLNNGMYIMLIRSEGNIYRNKLLIKR